MTHDFEISLASRDRLASCLLAKFEAEPVEDGIYHSAQGLIDAAWRSTERPRVLEWLRCVARSRGLGGVYWRANLVRRALATDDAQIRDAAVQAAEHWGGEEILRVLTNHDEPLPWLRRYVRDVIEDLRDTGEG